MRRDLAIALPKNARGIMLRAFFVLADSLDISPASGPLGRIDKWLWTVRVCKTRGLATAACRAGDVSIAGLAVKPSRDVRAGETILVRQGLVTRTLVVRAAPASRVGAVRLPEFCEELTTAEEWAKARAAPIEQFLARERGAGRPTKRDRRQIDALLD